MTVKGICFSDLTFNRKSGVSSENSEEEVIVGLGFLTAFLLRGVKAALLSAALTCHT